MTNPRDLWEERWVSPKIEVKPSPINKLGSFAKEPISKGETIAVSGGLIIPATDVKKYREIVNITKEMKNAIRGVQIDDDFFISMSIKEAGRLNHSCNPNLGYKNSITIIAIKDINPGEEVALEYAFSESNFEPFECTCKSENCRKIIKPTDWQIPELQKEGGKYFIPYLKDKIK